MIAFIRAYWFYFKRMLSKVGGDHHHGDPLGGCVGCDRGKADRWQ